MKYTTKSGKELPPEVVEVIERLQKEYGKTNFIIWDLSWDMIPKPLNDVLNNILKYDSFTEFYKLYPKKDYDSYGNEIVKGEMVEVRDRTDNIWTKNEFICFADKINDKYLTYDDSYSIAVRWRFCRKIQTISATEVLKSELQSQMNDLLKQAKEIEAKINEL